MPGIKMPLTLSNNVITKYHEIADFTANLLDGYVLIHVAHWIDQNSRDQGASQLWPPEEIKVPLSDVEEAFTSDSGIISALYSWILNTDEYKDGQKV